MLIEKYDVEVFTPPCESTCHSFALKLAVSQKKLADCPPLSEPYYAEKLAALEAIVIEAPAMGLLPLDKI